MTSKIMDLAPGRVSGHITASSPTPTISPQTQASVLAFDLKDPATRSPCPHLHLHHHLPRAKCKTEVTGRPPGPLTTTIYHPLPTIYRPPPTIYRPPTPTPALSHPNTRHPR